MFAAVSRGFIRANVRAERDRVAVRVHLLVVEVVVALRVGAERRDRPCSGASTSGAPLRQRPISFAATSSCSSGVSPCSRRKSRNFPTCSSSAGTPCSCRSAREFRAAGCRDDAVLVGVAEDELARLQRRAGAGRRFLAASVDHRLREAVAIAKMVVRIIERRSRVEVERREDLDAGAPGDQLRVLRDAAVVLRLVPREEDDDGMQIGARHPADPVFGGVHAGCRRAPPRAPPCPA